MSEEIKIEHGIPLPAHRRRSQFFDVVNKMKVGDSILIPKKHLPSVLATMLRIGAKGSVRKVDAEQKRVWRVE